MKILIQNMDGSCEFCGCEDTPQAVKAGDFVQRTKGTDNEDVAIELYPADHLIPLCTGCFMGIMEEGL